MIEVTVTDGSVEVRIPVDRALLDDPEMFGVYVVTAWKAAHE